MEKQLIASYTVTEDDEVSQLSFFKIADRFVCESETTDELDTIRAAYLKTRSETTRKDLAKKYETKVAVLNAEQPHQRYFKTLVI
jgi:hypothetical protein